MNAINITPQMKIIQKHFQSPVKLGIRVLNWVLEKNSAKNAKWKSVVVFAIFHLFWGWGGFAGEARSQKSRLSKNY